MKLFLWNTKFTFKADYFQNNFPDKNVVTRQPTDRYEIKFAIWNQQIVSLFKLTSMATSVSNNVESFALFGNKENFCKS